MLLSLKEGKHFKPETNAVWGLSRSDTFEMGWKLDSVVTDQ